MLPMVKAAVPVLVNVTAWAALVTLMSWLPKLRLAGFRPTAAAVPVPLTLTLCGLSCALSVMETLAVRLPVAVGVNVALMVQLLPAASVLEPDGQVLV